jgi:hypothetical protein
VCSLSYPRVLVFEDGSFSSVRCCKTDYLPCDREGCEVISSLGVPMVCSRKRPSRGFLTFKSRRGF